GPMVTVDTGERALVVVAYNGFTDAAGGSAVLSHAVSGASTIAASNDWQGSLSGTSTASGSGVALHTNLTPALNPFTDQYRRAGDATGASFQRRSVSVVPLA